MKIVQVVHSFPPRYDGVGNYCYQLSKHLAERGHQVEVITSKLYSNLPVEEVIDGFTIHRCPYFGNISTNRITFILNKLLNIEADIVHAHSYIFLTSNQAALAKKINRRPLLLHLHGGIEAFLPDKDILNRFIFGPLKNIYDSSVGKWTLKASDIIASVSKRDIELSQDIFQIDKELFRWIPNAVDLNIFNVSKKLNQPNNISYVLFIGSLIPRKGIGDLLKIAKLVIEGNPQAIFIIIGNGPLRKHLEESVHLFNGRLKILGRVNSEILLEWLSKASVLLLPSYSEGLPTVCIEALASEVPVVASDVGGTSEVVIENETGFLVPPGNNKIFVNRIMNLLDDENTRKKMGRNGRKLIEKYYTWDKVVETTEKTYKSII